VSPSTSRRRSVSWSALLLIAAAGPARAQSSIEVTPFIASFYALSTVSEQTDVPLDDFQGSPPGDIVREQQDGPAFGVRVSYPVSGEIRAEGEVAYALSDGQLTARPRDFPESQLGATADAHVLLASARAVYRPRRQNFFGLAGIGVVTRGGDFWEDADQSARVAGVVGLGVRAAVSPGLSLVFTAEAYLYSFSYSSSNVPNSENKFQQDLVVSVGVPIGAR
jgi:outer membrane protein with beta-barrel domain